jgi:tripartite-type tricarboxylate transporter receptor subunit TctC
MTLSAIRPALAAAVLVVSLAAFIPAASAQDFPTQPIKMVVGYAPGASVDLMARLSAEGMSQSLGQRIVIENRPGANSAMATRLVAKAPADGYNLLFNAMSMVSNLHGMKEPGYRLEEFTVIGGYGYVPYVLLVNTKSSGAKSLEEFVAFGRANPDKLTYSTLGPSSPPNLVANHFNAFAKMQWREIPFKSAADAVQGVAAGTVDVYFAAPGTAMGIKDQPNIAIFGITGKDVSPHLPNVPTFASRGYDLNDSFSLGVFAPASTPKPIVDKLRKALADAKANADLRKKIDNAGLGVFEGSTDEFQAELMRQSAMFQSDFKRLGIEPE